MLSSITLKFTESPDVTIPTSGITIFVGPNNSGKSLVLRELESVSQSSLNPNLLKVLKDYTVAWPDQAQLDAIIRAHRRPDRVGVPAGHVIVGRINPNGSLEETAVSLGSAQGILAQKQNKDWWFNNILRWGLLRLDGRSRFNLTNDQPGGDLTAPPGNVLSHLFTDDEARRRVRDIIHDAFGTYLVIDPTNLGTLRIRLSTEPPTQDEQSLNESARLFHSKAQHVKEASDGVQAFSGIVTAVLAGNFDVILVDEPEAFLHPPLARKLGRHLATLASQRGGTLMASTHSPDFLMGCLQGSQVVRVVRLEYSSGKSRGKMVDAQRLEAFLKRPLMRSANVISGLFHDGVVVTESDNDRAFYSEVYSRMSEQISSLPSILFVNAQNKQTIRDIIGPLRSFGVPAAAIPDIDIVKDGGKTWTDWLTAAGVPDALHIGYGQQRSSINDLLVRTGKDMKRDGGIAILSPENRPAAEALLNTLDQYGVFTVRRGELENWLPDLSIPGKKTDWAVAMLERLGGDPAAPSYVRPGAGDVWEFMGKIIDWVKDPARLGT